MFEICFNSINKWKIIDVIKSNLLVFGNTIYIEREYILNYFKIKIENIYFSNYNIAEIKYKSKYYINIEVIDNYEDLNELFYIKIPINKYSIKKNIQNILQDDELFKILYDCSRHNSEPVYYDRNLFCSIIAAKYETDNKEFLNNLGDGKFCIPKKILFTILNNIGFINNEVDYCALKFKKDFNYLFQKKFVSIKEFINDEERSLKICKDIVLFEELCKLNKSVFDKFIIYFTIHNQNDTYKEGTTFYTNNYDSFKNKYHLFKQKGDRAFIHGNYNNINAKKILDVKTFKRIKELFSSGVKYSFRHIARDINATLILEGKPPISISKIINILKQDSNYMTMHLHRYGREELNKFLPHPRRVKPNNSMSVIQMDGARINILTKDNGKLIFKYLVVALDTCSNKILAFRIIDVENFNAYFEIIKDIVNKYSILPQEIVLDNLKSLTSQNANVFFEKLKTLSINVRFHKKHNPQDKAQVENWFKLFNTHYLKDVFGFLGAGIKSKSKDSKPKEELIYEYRKSKNALSYNELFDIIHEKIELYNENHTLSNSKGTPNLIFMENIPEKKLKQELVSYYIYLFYKEIRSLINKSYISITIDGKIHEYMFYDNNYDFLKKYFNKYIIARYDINNPKVLYIYDNKSSLDFALKLTLHESVPMASHEMSKSDVRNSKKHHFRIQKLKDNISKDLSMLRESILEFNYKTKKNKPLENLKLVEVPIDLINEKFDNKELINNSLEKEYNRENELEILLNIKSLFKMKGSNDIIN